MRGSERVGERERERERVCAYGGNVEKERKGERDSVCEGEMKKEEGQRVREIEKRERERG